MLINWTIYYTPSKDLHTIVLLLQEVLDDDTKWQTTEVVEFSLIVVKQSEVFYMPTHYNYVMSGC